VNLTLGPLVSALAAGNRVILKPSELTPNAAAWMRRLIASLFDEDQVAWSNALQGAGQLRVQFRVVRSDGVVVHVDNLAVLVMDPHSGERRLVGITLDISERVAAEQRERRLQKQLMEASHQSGMAEVATGVLHNVGNVLNSLGISVSTAQAKSTFFTDSSRVMTYLGRRFFGFGFQFG